MPDTVIDRVNHLAINQPQTLTFADKQHQLLFENDSKALEVHDTQTIHHNNLPGVDTDLTRLDNGDIPLTGVDTDIQID